MPRNNILTVERREPATDASAADLQDFREAVSAGEGELLGELVRALRMIRYGSITLTLHDGRLVEIQKTERIRRNGNKENSADASRE